MDTLVDDFGNIKKIMNTKTKKKIVYSAGEGCPSTGAAASCKAGPAASSSSNRGQPGVDRQTPGRALASGEEDTGASRGGTRRRRGGGGGLDPTTKHRCVLPLRPLRGRSASDLTGGSQGPLRAPPPPPTVATVTRDGASGGGTHLRGIRTPRGCRLPEKGRREARGAGRTPTPTPMPRPPLWQPPPLPTAAVPTAATLREATGRGPGPDRSMNKRPRRARNRPTVRGKRKAHTCGGGCAFWRGRSAVSGRRWTGWPRSARRGQPRALTARARGKRGGSALRGGRKEKPPGTQRELLWVYHPRLSHTSGQRRVALVVPTRWEVTLTIGKRTSETRWPGTSRPVRGSQDPVPPQVGGVVAGNKASGSDPPGYGCCRRRKNRASTVKGDQRHLAAGRRIVDWRGKIHGRHMGRKRKIWRKNRKPAAQPLPKARAPTEGAKSGRRGGHAWTRRSRATAPPGGGSNLGAE